MSRRRKIVIGLLACPWLLLGAILLYLATGDLSVHRGRVARWISGAMGRQLLLHGRFQPRLLSPSPSIVADDILLADPDGGRDPGMVRVDHLEGRVGLRSLFSPPVRIEWLRVQGARVRLGADRSGSPNWVFGSAGAAVAAPAAGERRLPVAFGEVVLEGVTLLWEPPEGSPAILLQIDRLELAPEDEARHRLRLEGRLQDRPLRLSGTLTRLEELLFVGRDASADLRGTFGTSEVALRGTFADLYSLAQPEAELWVRGRAIEEVTTAFALPSAGTGSYEFEAQVEPRDGRVGLSVGASLGEARAAVSGVLAGLTDLSTLELTVRASGPDLRSVAAPFGGSSLPPVPFSAVIAAERRTDGGLALRGVDLRAGDARILIDGVLGAPPGMAGTELTVDVSGDELRPFEEFAGVELPPGAYAARGRLRFGENGLEVEGGIASVGSLTARVDGRLGARPALRGSDLSVEIRGPQLGLPGKWFGLGLPEEPFVLSARLGDDGEHLTVEDGRFDLGRDHLEASGSLDPATFPDGLRVRLAARGPDLGRRLALADLRDGPALPYSLAAHVTVRADGYAISGLHATVGEDSLDADGSLGPLPVLAGTDLTVRGRGEDLARWRGLAGFDLPSEPWDIEGRVAIGAGGYDLEDLRVGVGPDRARIDGRLGSAPGPEGTALRLESSGPDLAARGASLGLDGLPAAAWHVSGEVQGDATGYAVRDVEVVLGPVSVLATGRLGPPPSWDGTWADLRVDVGDLAEAAGILGLPSLPARPLRLEGGVALEEDRYRLEEVRIAVGDHRATIDGVLGPPATLEGTSLRIEGSGPDYVDLFRMAAEAGWIAAGPLPEPGPWELHADLGRTPEAYEIGGARVRIGRGSIAIDGRVGARPDGVGTSLQVDAEGADAAILGRLVGVDLPADAYRVRGGIGVEPGGYRFDHLEAQLGENRVSADGRLGLPPRFTDSQLSLRAEAADLGLLERLTGWTMLPAGPVALEARVEGGGDEVQVKSLLLSAASSDLSGDVRVRTGEVPRIEATLASRRVDVADLPGRGPRTEAGEQWETEPIPVHVDETEAPPEEGSLRDVEVDEDDLVFPVRPFDFSWMELASLDVHWEADEVVTRSTRIHEVAVGVRMDADRLEVGPFLAYGDLGGRVQMQGSLERGDDGVRLDAGLEVDALRLARLAPGGDISRSPPVDVDLRFQGAGRSPHELMAFADGKAVIVFHEGEIDNSLVDRLAADVLLQFLKLFNPFHKEDPTTRFECGVAAARLDGGVLHIDPLAARTDKLTVVGDGRVRLENEALRLTWAVKPRKGIGVSATAITNPYIKLAGTLGDPNLTVKPLDAVVSTGAAVATMGLSLLARGMWDRATAERKVCRRALKQIAKEDARRAEATAPAPGP